MKQKHVTGIIAIAAILITTYSLFGFSGALVLNNASGGEKPEYIDKDKLELPDFAQKTVRVEEAYTFAVQNQDWVMYIACYCGCANMQHSDRLLQHKSLKDCYIRPDGSFEPHASACKLCNDITLKAKELFGKGYSLKEVRQIIDESYSGRGVGTRTPLPP